MLREWADGAREFYSSVYVGSEEEWLYASRHPFAREDERYAQISKLRQEGLEEARRIGANYLFVRTVVVVVDFLSMLLVPFVVVVVVVVAVVVVCLVAGL